MAGSPTTKEKANSATTQAIIRSCDTCRKKNIRCQPTGDACFQCRKYRTHCHFTPISTKRKPRRPAGYKYVGELEASLKRMEGLLKDAMERGNLGKGVGMHDQDVGVGVMELASKGESEEQSASSTSLITVPQGKQTSTIPVSPISFVSAFRGLNKNMAQDQNETVMYESLLSTERPSPLWKGSFIRDIFSRQTFGEMPSKSTALVLIEEAFGSFNSSMPIFNQQSFLQTFHDHYSESSPSDPGWWACINVVLALAHRFRAMRTLETGRENSQGCAHMQNALAVVSELTMLHNSLSAVQALVGMAIVLQGTPNPRLCSVLIAAAMRLAQSMDLHRKNRDPTLSGSEIEQRKRIFWIAYILDKDVSLRTGQPPSQDDDDMDVELPSETISDLTPVYTCVEGIIFECRIGLAMIQGQVYKRLYSVKATKQSEVEQLFATYELNAMLAAWRKNFPIDFDDETLTTLQAPIAPAHLHKIILRFTYVNCLISIHRQFPQNSVTSAWDEICVTEARKAVRLIEITPRGDYASAWLLLHYFFAAVTTILHAIVLNPSHLLARSDVKLVEPFLGLLELLAKEGKSEEAQRMFECCRDLNQEAEGAVARVNNRMICSGRKEKTGKESVGDFIRRVECQSRGYPGPESAVVELEMGGENWLGFGGNEFNTFEMMVE